MALTVGSRLGHYDVTALIGEGGMGQVYQANDTKLHRDVALKILPEAFASDPDRLARFQREAQVLASLNHPGIAAIYGIEDSEDTKALVLELVEGPTLADRIAQGPIPVDEALPIAKQIAEALEAAHEAGVIHRDLKPANIKVKDDGTVKVLDFGLAKALDTTPEGDPSQSPTITAAATRMGVIMGTAAYMSPEQARGKPVDRRSDVWAFGAVVYEMLSGRRAFVGDDVSDTIVSVLRDDPDWSAVPDDVPPRVRQALLVCLQKEPTQRVRDISAIRLAMEGAFETVATPVESVLPPPLRVWQRPIPLALAGLALVIVGGVVVRTLTPAPPPRPVVRLVASTPAAPLVSPTTAGNTEYLAISPDGTRIAYQTLPTGAGAIYVRRLDQLNGTRLGGAESAAGPFFSPDGMSVGFATVTDRTYKVVSVLGGSPVTLWPDFGAPRGASWGLDDAIIFAGADSGGLLRGPASGGEPEVLTTPDETQGEVSHWWPEILPGGQAVLFTIIKGEGDQNRDIAVLDLASGETRVLVSGGTNPRYASTGHIVYGRAGSLWAVPFDLDGLAVKGDPVRVLDRVRIKSTGAAEFALSSTGSLLYASGDVEAEANIVTLTWLDRDGTEEAIAVPPRAYDHPRVSPDGTQIAMDIADGDNTDIWIWDLEQENSIQVTFDEADDDFPLWTPDGARVVFRSSRDGGGLFWKAADGTGQVEQLKEGRARPYAWATDGRLIFEQTDDIGVLTMDGEETVEMLLEAEFREGDPQLSPDGRWLVYWAEETPGDPVVYGRPFPNIDDGRWNVSQGFGAHAVWSPDGDELFYRSLTGFMSVQVETEPTLRLGTPELLFRPRDITAMVGGSTAGQRFDVAPDGRFIMRKPGGAGQASDDADINGLIFVANWFEELTERVPVD